MTSVTIRAPMMTACHKQKSTALFLSMAEKPAMRQLHDDVQSRKALVKTMEIKISLATQN